jgi:hypothetical protein
VIECYLQTLSFASRLKGVFRLKRSRHVLHVSTTNYKVSILLSQEEAKLLLYCLAEVRSSVGVERVIAVKADDIPWLRSIQPSFSKMIRNSLISDATSDEPSIHFLPPPCHE